MTDDPGNIEEAKQQADDALREAQEMQRVSSRLAREWRNSRVDNNFRAMLRRLVPGGE